MPPNSFGDCGAHSPEFFAFSRTFARRASGIFSWSEKFCGSVSSGSTCSSTNARTRSRRSSISGASVKSMPYPLPFDLNDLSAIDDDGRARDVTAGVRHQQQQRTVEIAGVAETAHRNLTLDGSTCFAGKIVVIHFGDEPAGRDRVDAHTFERQLDGQRLGDLHDARFCGGVGN